MTAASNDTTEALRSTIAALQTARSALADVQQRHAEPVAVVGAACRLPGGVDSLTAYGEFLRAGGDGVTDVPSGRWDVEAYFDAEPDVAGRSYSRRIGAITDIAAFDAGFFGISPREATAMDPQQRLLLETTWEALEHAAIPAETLGQARTGVFVGMCANDYGSAATDPARIDIYSATGAAPSVAAGRIAYQLGLTGPALVVDTACSSSLVALHLAVQSLRSRECDVAVVGGVNLIVSPESMIEMSRLKALSPSGRCSPFAAGADGYVRGEGCGVVVLKRAGDAAAAHDRVLATVLATALNQDGRSNGLTVPNGRAQEKVLREALRQAKLTGPQIDYIEAHGTGTPLGDPIELRALNAVFGADRDQPLLVGSVKGNFGHLEAAAGIAGLLKAIVVVRDRMVPATLHFTEPNPLLDWKCTNIEVPTESRTLPADRQIHAGVSSFGFSGTNAHVMIVGPAGAVVEDGAVVADPGREMLALPMSARSVAALRVLAGRQREQLADRSVTEIRDICFTATRRAALDVRAVLIGETGAALQRGLGALAEGRERTGVHHGRRAQERGPLVFVFSGHGGQWPGMGTQLMADHPVFRDAVERCAAALQPLLGVNVAEALAKGFLFEDRLDLGQPSLFAFQVGLAELLGELGLRPDVVAGHSIGEVAAAYIAGALPLGDAAKIVCERSRALQAISGSGGLLSVPVGVAEVADRLVHVDGEFDIAAVNGPANVVVSGAPDALDRLAEHLTAEGLDARRLKISSAAHSRQLDPGLTAFGERLGPLQPRRGQVPFLSTVDAEYVPGSGLDAGYWMRNLRETVQLGAAVDRVLQSGPGVFLEVGPSPVLVDAIVDRIVSETGGSLAVPTLKRNGYARRDLLELAGRLHVHGVDVNWPAFGVAGGRVVDLPSYPWQHTSYWAASDWDRAGEHSAGYVNVESSISGERIVQRTLDTDRAAWMLDHSIGETPVVPGAWFVNLAAAAYLEQQTGPGCALIDVRFERPLTMAPGDRRAVQVVIRDTGFHVSGQLDDGAWIEHVRGRLGAASPSASGPGLDAARAACPRELSGRDFYAAYRARGMNYASAFQTVTQIHLGDGEAVAEVRATGAAGDREHGLVAPALLDGCFQVVGALAAADELFVPSAVQSISLSGPMPARVWVHVHGYSREARLQVADLDVYDWKGALLATVRGLTATRVDEPGLPDEIALLDMVWHEREAATPGRLSGHWLLVSAGADAVATGFAEPLTAAGASVTTIRIDPRASRAAQSTPLLESSEPPAGVVYLAGTGDAVDLEELLGVTQEVVAAGNRPSPRLCIVTCGGQAVAEESVDPWQAALWGFGTALHAEHPELRTMLVDVAGPDDFRAVVAELTTDEECHVALRGDRRHVGRLETAAAEVLEPKRGAAGGRPFALEIGEPGRLETMTFNRRRHTRPGPGQVLVEVAAAGLNFADVMRAMGFFGEPDEARVVLGSECSGTVVAVGPDVQAVCVGQSVVAVALGCFATHVLADASLVYQLPVGLGLTDAAALPTAYTTACHALENIARIRSGDRILIHSASGGTGIAAIAVARSLGAEVYATAGTSAKRRYLRDQGVEYVFDSRTLEFESAIADLTGGAGVDVVLNSLTGPALAASLRTVAADGVFLELGKRDIHGGGQLPLEHFKRRITYAAIDMAGLHAERPATFARLLHRTIGRVMSGELPLLPVETHPIATAADVFRRMSAGEHIGKLVLETSAAASTAITKSTVQDIAAPGSHLITGGLGGLGLELARWLVDNGARQITLMARSVPGPRAQQAIGELRDRGAGVTVELADVADANQVNAVVDRMRLQTGPVRGVFHLAAVLRDGVLTNQSWAVFDEVLRPKAIGAWNLHRATLSDPVEHFVLYSSAAAMLPSGGQLNYAAANGFLDGLARYRRSRNLPATAIAWGPFRDVGLAAGSAATDAYLSGRGIRSATTAQAHPLLAALLDDGRAQAGAIALDPTRWLEAHPFAWTVPLYEQFRSGSGADPTAGPVLLRQLPPVERDPALLAAVTERLAAVLRVDVDEIAPDTPFVELGLSSLALLEFRNGLAATLNLDLPGAVHWQHPTVRAMHRYLIGRFGEEEGRR